MTIHFKQNGGVLRGGLMNGNAEIYNEDSVTGEGTVYIGDFVKGKLNDSAGVYVIYTNNSFIKYSGTFIDNRMDGDIEVIEYKTDYVRDENEQNEEGHGVNANNGLFFIGASNNNTTLFASKKNIIFSDGVEGATISNISQSVKIEVESKKYNGKNIFIKFNIVLV